MKSTRRTFLKTTAGAALAAAGCATNEPAPKRMATAVTPKRPRRTLGPNDRIRCAFIGIGSRGSSILGSALTFDDVDMVAVADTYDANRERALGACKKKYPGATGYVRFENLLEKEQIDAIITATPDHIHVPVILAALDMGLDVYTEKPMTLTWESAKQVRDRANAADAVIQVGTQLRSMEMYQRLRDVVQSGELGKLLRVRVNRDGKSKPLDKADTPAGATEQNTHWPLFLRETKPYPYDPLRYFHWRQFVEYSNGYYGDLMLHHLDICHFVTGCGMPSAVKAVGGIYTFNDGRTCPDTVSALLEYAEKFQFNYSTTVGNGHFGLFERYLFTNGTVEVRGMGEMSIYRGDNEEKVGSKGILNEPHLQNFFDAMRSRNATIAPVEAGLMAATCAHMAVMSMNSGRAAAWDGENGTVRLA
ncbi:MAG TPA: Gfo/Idh/MocA family oxidoreductase [Candidatus Bathyarchaeia archaeon]|nr:Gfo/Idh/MocA family oxidoreductase [Candidatus Bathyarchaeia archaeon]